MTVLTLGPAVLDLAGIRAGDRNLIQFTLTRAGGPVDLTGQTLMAHARYNASSVDPPALAAVVVITDAPGGVLTVRWPGDDVRALMREAPTWRGVWDLQMAAGGSDPVTMVAGAFTAVSDVTR
jgi:hypothetical protein